MAAKKEKVPKKVTTPKGNSKKLRHGRCYANSLEKKARRRHPNDIQPGETVSAHRARLGKPLAHADTAKAYFSKPRAGSVVRKLLVKIQSEGK